MSMLPEADRQAVTDALASLLNPVKLTFFTQSIGCETCLSTRQILDELVSMSDKLTIEELNVVLDQERAADYGVDRAPSVVLETDHDSRIRFVGAPAGYEFAALVDAIRLASAGESGLSEESKALIATVTKPVRIQVFVTPT